MNNEAHQKITTAHLSRLAYLYVRQSTLRQVLRYREHPSSVCAARARCRVGLAAGSYRCNRQRPRAVRRQRC